MYWLGDRTNKVWETWWNEHRKVTKIVKTCLSQPGHFPSTSTKIWQNYKAKSTYNQRHQWYKIMSEEKVRTLTPSTIFFWCWWQLKVPNSALSCDFTDFKKWNENLSLTDIFPEESVSIPTIAEERALSISRLPTDWRVHCMCRLHKSKLVKEWAVDRVSERCIICLAWVAAL